MSLCGVNCKDSPKGETTARGLRGSHPTRLLKGQLPSDKAFWRTGKGPCSLKRQAARGQADTDIYRDVSFSFELLKKTDPKWFSKEKTNKLKPNKAC